MKPTIETGNVSQQPECLGEKRYEVILDFGKPSSEKVATLGEVAALLKVGYDLFQAEGDGDVLVFDRGFDVTDSQVIQEMIGEIMEESEHSAKIDEGFPEEDHNIHVEEAQLEAMEEEAQKCSWHELGGCRNPRKPGSGCTWPIEECPYTDVKHPLSSLPEIQQGNKAQAELVALYKKRPEICKARAEAMGLEACLDCPVRCNVSDDNYNQLINIVEANPDAFPDRKSGVQERCTYGDAPADGKCSACSKPLCPTCGYKLGDDHLCNSCWELDPR